jgi:hypothetical protein
MRKFNLLFLVMIFLLAISLHGPLMAQDTLVTNTPVAEVTPEPVVTPAPVVDVPAVENPLTPILEHGMEIILLIAVLILALRNKDMISEETMDKVLGKVFGYAKEVTTRIPGELDDQLLKIVEEAARRIIKDELASNGNPPTSVN